MSLTPVYLCTNYLLVVQCCEPATGVFLGMVHCHASLAALMGHCMWLASMM